MLELLATVGIAALMLLGLSVAAEVMVRVITRGRG
jgi:hypothetical protein